jgi:glutamate dehydrogenase
VVSAGVSGTDRVWLHDMTLERASGGTIEIDEIQELIEAALLALFRGLAESDGFNRLVLEAGLGWRDVAMMRALGRYLRQVIIPYAQDYLAETLARHSAIAVKVVQLFYARFDPRVEDSEVRAATQAEIRAVIEEQLKNVTSLDDDRILRRFINLVEAAIRTNFFQLEGNGLPRQTIAFKFECARVEGLPLPKPLYEIFVYSPRVEGIHLRYGKVARGGLRWSDRPQDFRTEVLGLVKAQQVKNAVIVPVGAKGGFVPKRLPPPTDRQAWLAEGTESYRIFGAPCCSSPTTSSATTWCRRRRRCATTGTTPIWSLRPTRARPPSRTRRTSSPSRRGIGSGTPSRPAAARATTTRRWASRPAAHGRR